MARAQGVVFDHLACHPIKDTLPRGSVRADLFPAQSALFPVASGCRVKLPAKLFCADVQKRNVQPPAPLVVDGNQTRDFFCYAVACPRSAEPSGNGGFEAEDQFGARRVFAKRPRMLCAPANLLVPTPTPTPTRTVKPCGRGTDGVCGGDCGPFSTCFDFGIACGCEPPTPMPPTPTPTP